MDRRQALRTIGLSTLAAPLLASCAAEEEDRADIENPEQGEDDGMADFLFVQEAEGIRFEGDRMTLLDVSPKTLFFTDRPQELAGYLSYEEFMDMVTKGPDNFEDDPPNATVVTHGDDGFRNVVVRLSRKPSMDGANLTFPSVKVIDGDPPAEGGAVALFIDTVGRPASPGSVAGAHRRHRRRAAAHHK
jgi:hypothetical protein